MLVLCCLLGLVDLAFEYGAIQLVVEGLRSDFPPLYVRQQAKAKPRPLRRRMDVQVSRGAPGLVGWALWDAIEHGSVAPKLGASSDFGSTDVLLMRVVDALAATPSVSAAVQPAPLPPLYRGALTLRPLSCASHAASGPSKGRQPL